MYKLLSSPGMNIGTCKHHLATPVAALSYCRSNRMKISLSACILLVFLIHEDIWSCFCACNHKSGPCRQWLWNIIWVKCSQKYRKYQQFTVCNTHLSAVQGKVISLCVWLGVEVKTDNGGRISLLIRIHGTIKKMLTYTGTPQQNMPAWITCNVLLQSTLWFSLRLCCHPVVISEKQWDTSQIQTIHSFHLHEVYFTIIELFYTPCDCTSMRTIHSDTTEEITHCSLWSLRSSKTLALHVRSDTQTWVYKTGADFWNKQFIS